MRSGNWFRRLRNSFAAALFFGVVGVANLAAPLAHATGTFSGSGSGTGGDPYVITSCAQFTEITEELDASYKLGQNLDCSASGGAIQVGYLSAFTGDFDGGNHTLTVNISSNQSVIGVFGTVNGGSIKNLTVAGVVTVTSAFSINYVGVVAGDIQNSSIIDNVHVTATLNVPVDGVFDRIQGVGSIAGRFQSSNASNVSSSGDITAVVGKVGGLFGTTSCGSITDSHSTADITAPSRTFVGGLVGFDSCGSPGTTFTRDYATGDVIGGAAVGGLIGGTNGAAVLQSYTTGNVTGDTGSYDTGGVIGEADSGASITNSYATGNVTGGQAVGGVAGVLGASGTGTISKSFATGVVSGTANFGGLAGWVISGTVTDSFWDTQTSGIATGAGNGVTTAAMKSLATYTSLETTGLTSAWDFAGTPNDDEATDDIWAFYDDVNDGYPCLAWQDDCTDVPEEVATEVSTGPNNGDANGDGVQDSTQTNIAGSVNPVTNHYALVEVGTGCTVSNQSVSSVASQAAKDSDYTYPAGLMNFTVQGCGAPGYTTTVTQYYYGLANSSFVLRKYNPATKKYTTVAGAVVSKVTIGGQQVTKVSYQVTDGGALDEDGSVNGVIVDPAGLAVANLANTGISIGATSMLAGALTVAAIGVTLVGRRKTVHRYSYLYRKS